MYPFRLPFKKIFFIHAALICFKISITAQNIEVIGRCGGSYSKRLPAFTDKDKDGLSDDLELALLNKFVPIFIQFKNEDCPGPAMGASNLADSNLAVCRIFPLFQQYTADNNVSEIKDFPEPLVNKRSLHSGLVWYDNQIIIYGAVLYGRDCGLHGHFGDVEGFAISLKYTGIDNSLSWRSDTNLTNWEGLRIQTISHAGTFCQTIETFPYRSSKFPKGKDTVFVSPDKHGNYLTIQGCNSTFICNPRCNGSLETKKIKIVNVGEASAPFVTDLGLFYKGYKGESPWSSSNFLNGGAGSIRAKILREWRSDFVIGEPIKSEMDINKIYKSCNN